MSDDATLITFVRAIAQGDQARVVGLLAGAPELASARLAVGATRRGAEDYFFDEIEHHVYAGDTALHIAAGPTPLFSIGGTAVGPSAFPPQT